MISENDAEAGDFLLVGDKRMGAVLGTLGEPGLNALVYDAGPTDPADWSDLERLLLDFFRAAKTALTEQRSIVAVVDEPSLYGHASALRSALATGLFGGIRTLALEGRRDEVPANAVAASDAESVERIARTVRSLSGSGLTGQLLTCADAHLGRPSV